MLDPLESRFGRAALTSGLIDAEGLIACWNAIPPAKRDEPEHVDRRIARQAVQARTLTLWQAQQLLAGRSNGFKVDRYVLLELIGQGGMGRVYLAMDTRLSRRVALKILSPERISNPRAVARFQREARVGAQLQHENLVRVYDFGEFNGRYFLVMEFIEGKTIGRLLAEQGPMPAATAARLVRQVAHGLAHADRKGLIHRDVNPYNILVTHDGVAKLADLGLAIDLAECDRVTRDGATVGTFDYVAPEQARHSHAADIRSDIYSLGCTLYHMLTAHVPFPSPSLPEKLFAHHSLEPTPVEDLVPDLPPGLGEIVRTMMRKKPEERFSSPLQVAQALEPYGEEGVVRLDTVPLAADVLAPAPAGSATSKPSDPVNTTPTPSSAVDDAAAPTDPPGPEPAPADRSRWLVATAVPSVRPTTPRQAVPEVATALSATPPRDLDDPNIPLLTPADDDPADVFGLPIVLDLGIDAPLNSPATRRGSPSKAGIARLFPTTATSQDKGRYRRSVAKFLRRPGLTWRGLSPEIRAAILTAAAIILVGAVVAWMRRSPPADTRARASGAQPRTVSDADVVKPSPATRSTRQDRPSIVVLSHDLNDDGERVQPTRSLAEAVAAAVGRGKSRYVELRNSQPLQLGPADFVDLTNGHGRLDIRAAAGTEPVIEVRLDGPRPFLSTGSAVSLSLSGVTIRARYPATTASPATDPPAIIQAAGPVELNRCAFERVGPSRENAGVVSSDGASLGVEQCWFRGFDAPIRIKAYVQTVAHVRQSMIVPDSNTTPGADPASRSRRWAIRLEILGAHDSAKSKRRLTLDHCTVDGSGVLAVTGDAGQAPLVAEVTHCAVRGEALLAWTPRNPGDRLDADLRWQGKGNQFQILGASWMVASARPSVAISSPAVTDLAGWSRTVSREAAPIHTRIVYRTDPDKRSESSRPTDFAIESTDPPDDRAGADPALVGPWTR